MLSIVQEILKMLNGENDKTFTIGFYIIVIAVLFIFILFTFIWILNSTQLYNAVSYFIKQYIISLKKNLPDRYLYALVIISGLIIILSIYIDLYHSVLDKMIHIGLLSAIGKALIYVGIILIPTLIIIIINYFTQNFFDNKDLKRSESNLIWLPVICIFITKMLFFSDTRLLYTNNLTKLALVIGQISLLIFDALVIVMNYIAIYKNIEKYIVYKDFDKKGIRNFNRFKVFMVVSWLIILLLNIVNMVYWAIALDPQCIRYHVKGRHMGLSSVIYFTIITFFTVGYGDISAYNWFGQLIVSVIVISGWLYIIVGAGSILAIEKRSKE
ncbi:ion channel [Cellulosilyticum sp. I15G10I2]|uniref:ion channel n=1 Tax=Cellulosilyticum sp. I15G10I2 TaxID=1892843 RepID=UPI00085C2E68|nr:ion channel [Cellulosilyticum sp. I15G10I2]